MSIDSAVAAAAGGARRLVAAGGGRARQIAAGDRGWGLRLGGAADRLDAAAAETEPWPKARVGGECRDMLLDFLSRVQLFFLKRS